MVIIRTKFLREKEKIQNKMSLLLERVSPSSRIHMDILEYYSISRSRFGLLASAYLIVQRFNVLELRVNYLRCLYDI